MTAVRTILPLLIAAALLLSANGMQATVLTLRALEEDFSTFVIGLLLSAYFAGFIAGCRYAPRFIASVGHIRAFTAFASIASAAALAHAVIVNEYSWLLLRAVTGFAFAALQMILESWLNEVATNETRGKILSTYRITDFASVTVAQVAVGWFAPSNFTIYALLSILLSIALVPVALTRVAAPEVPGEAKLDLGNLWRVSPLAAAAAVAVGFAASAYWSMGPVFLTAYDYPSSTVGLFIAAIIFGGAVAQWPIGAVSDRIDRRLVLMACATWAAVIAAILPFAAGMGQGPLILAALCFGIGALPCFGLAVAHANDLAEPGNSVSVNGGLLMLYGVAAVFGPIVAGQIMGLVGNWGLFAWVGVVNLLLVLFSFYRFRIGRMPTEKEPYVSVPRTSPAVFELDPRGQEESEEAPASDDEPVRS